MIKRWSNALQSAEAYLFSHTPLRIAVYALIAAALLVMWLATDGDSVAFVYNEF